MAAMNMPTDEAQPILKCDNILVSPRGIAEVHGNKVMVFVPASGIDRITLRFGRSDHHPVLSLSIGLALAVAGMGGLYWFVVSPGGWRYELGLAAMGVIGGSVVFDTMKQRFYFEVHKRSGARRLILSKQLKNSRCETFAFKSGRFTNMKSPMHLDHVSQRARPWRTWPCASPCHPRLPQPGSLGR